MTDTLVRIAETIYSPLLWPLNTPALVLLVAVGWAAAIALTLTDRQRRTRADDALLDRLGSTTPGQPHDDLDAALLAWRNEIDTPPMPALVDVDTAQNAIQAGA
jgi:hypothetical protein